MIEVDRDFHNPLIQCFCLVTITLLASPIVWVGMLNRSRSYPGDLFQLSHQNKVLTDRKVLKFAKHSSDPHGSCVPPKLRRFEALGYYDNQLSKDTHSLSSPLVHKSLTKSITGYVTRSGEDFLKPKESQNQPLAEPATLLYGKRLRNDSHPSSISQEKNLQREGTLLVFHKLEFHERRDEPLSNSWKIEGDPRASTTNSHLRRQEGNANLFSRSTLAEPLEIESSQLSSMERIDREGTKLRKLWHKRKEKRRMGSLILLNVLAALYGSSNVANGIVADAAPSLPVSLTSLVRFTSALLFFTPALATALKNKDMELLRAGIELGGLAFAATVVDSCNPSSGSSSSAALLFAFTVIFIPIMEIFAGHRSSSTLTRFATIAAISGMGLLEEEGFGWRGISCPQIGDLWGTAVSVISALHIFRSEYHCGRFDPLLLNAVQCGVLAILSLGWETFTTFDVTAFQAHDIVNQVQSLPWAPLIYNGLVCFGLCSWLELHGLRAIHASTATLVYTTIPVWGAFLSFFAHHEMPTESAVIGGLLIMVTSIYAQVTATNGDVRSLGIQRKGSDLTSSNSDCGDGKGPKILRSDILSSARNKSTADETTNDYFPGALLTSQLKFPYYAAQAKRLLAEVKIKLGALKSFLVTTASSSFVTSTTGTTSTGSPGVSNASAGAPSTNIHEANSLPSSTQSVTSATSHIAKVDITAAQNVPPHGPVDIVDTVVSPSSEILSEALKASHSSDLTAIVFNVGTHAFGAVTTGIESALVVVGSDIMIGYEEAEDAATLLERLMKVGAENAAHIAAACLSGALRCLGSISSDFVEFAAHIPHELASGKSLVLPFPSYLPDSFVQNVLLLANHIQ